MLIALVRVRHKAHTSFSQNNHCPFYIIRLFIIIIITEENIDHICRAKKEEEKIIGNNPKLVHYTVYNMLLDIFMVLACGLAHFKLYEKCEKLKKKFYSDSAGTLCSLFLFCLTLHKKKSERQKKSSVKLCRVRIPVQSLIPKIFNLMEMF